MKKLILKKNLGFTLVEILLVVGFIAIAGISVYTVYSKVQLNNNANIEAKNIDVIRSGIKALYAGSGNTTTLTNTVVNNASISPLSMRGATIGIITNSFGGTVTITPVALNGPGSGFRISSQNIPSGVCISLATGIGSQFDQLSIGGVIVKPLGTTTVVDVVTATTECAKDVGSGVTLDLDSIK